MSYSKHPSHRLCSLFEKKPWQGADPLKAKYIFVGLDANYAADVGDKVPEIWDYLNDGPRFWRKTGYHHPFRLPRYTGCGDRYHEAFAKIGFRSAAADLVSFVELLHVPTMGRNKLQVGDLDERHLRWLNDILETGPYAFVFVPRAAAELMRKTKAFPWLPARPVRVGGGLDVLMDRGTGQMIFQMFHLSCYGWQKPKLERQIRQVRDMIAVDKNEAASDKT